jgi:hypothetical protein
MVGEVLCNVMMKSHNRLNTAERVQVSLEYLDIIGGYC